MIVVEKPGSKYIGHISLESSHDINIANEIWVYFQNNNMAISNLKLIVCDKTTLNPFAA